MKFADIVFEVARLAKKQNDENGALRKLHGIKGGLRIGSKEAMAFMSADRPSERALREYLDSLDEPTVLKLEAVMYGGRDKNPNFRELKDEISDGKEEAITMMCEKMPLGNYLMEGLVLAQKNFIDLEAEL